MMSSVLRLKDYQPTKKCWIDTTPEKMTSNPRTPLNSRFSLVSGTISIRCTYQVPGILQKISMVVLGTIQCLT